MFIKRDSKTPPYLMGFRRALYRGVGFTGEALDRPLIGVVNSWGEISPATKHMKRLATRVKAGVENAGGTPVEFMISGLCDGTCAGAKGANIYNMAWRDIAAAYIETVVEANQLDGLVFISVCDEVVPAHLMAAARLDLPSIMLSGGTMLHGNHNGSEVWAGSATEAYDQWKKNEKTKDYCKQVEECSCSGAGACGVMGTGNTMQAFAEAIGFTLPGNAVVPGVAPRLERQAYETGRRAVGLVMDNLRPSMIMSRAALENAIRVVLALGGSTNVVLHALALAYELGHQLELKDFDRWSRETPFICDIQPSGRYPVNRLDSAGGIPAVMRELKKMLHCEIVTVTGKTVLDIIEGAPEGERTVIHSLDTPITSEGGIAVLFGNLAPGGCVIKQSASAVATFCGEAKVFEDEEAACTAISSDLIKAGDIVVVRGMGPRGGPGLPCLYASLWLLKSRGLDDKVALVTDGRLSGTIRGIAVAHVAPESAVGGPLALLRNGDRITIDISGRRIDWNLGEEEIQRRKDNYSFTALPPIRGFMSIYRKLVQSADKGAYLGVKDEN